MSNGKKRRLEAEKEELNKQALEILQSPDLLPRYLDITARIGLVGEEGNALAVFMTGVSRLLPKPLHLIIKGQSSAGKNYLANCSLRTFPPDSIIELTSSSATAWNYAEDDFVHRVVYLQERNESSGAVHPLRLLISEGKLIRIVTEWVDGRRVQKRHETKGPIASISTTTKDQLQIDEETRNVSIWVDESKSQTRRIALAYAKNIDPPSDREIEIWRTAHRILETRVGVKIQLPDWFEKIGAAVYDGDIRVRRYFPAFTTICRTMAMLRSFQPGPKAAFEKAGFVEVSFEDYAISWVIFESIFRQSLHRGDDQALKTRATVAAIASRQHGRPVSVVQLANELSISKNQAYARLRYAVDRQTIRRANAPKKGNKKVYLPTSMPSFLPHPNKVFEETPAVGDWFRFIHPVTGEWILLRRK